MASSSSSGGTCPTPCKFMAQFGFCPSSEFCGFVGSHPAVCRDGNHCLDYACALSHTEPLCSSWQTCIVFTCPRRHSASRPTLLPHGGHPQYHSHNRSSTYCLGEEEDGSMTDAESDTAGSSTSRAQRSAGNTSNASNNSMVSSPEKRASLKRGRDWPAAPEEATGTEIAKRSNLRRSDEASNEDCAMQRDDDSSK